MGTLTLARPPKTITPIKKKPVGGLCYGCMRTVKQRCFRCKRCEKCGCTCYYCHDCKIYHKHQTLCTNCESCKKTCKCGHKPGFKKNLAWPHDTKGLDTLLNPFKRAVSVEIELNYFGDPPIYRTQYRYAKNAYTEHDGSVSGSNLEMIVPELLGDKVVLGLTEIGVAMGASNCTVDASCGFHVHVDARDWQPLQVFSLLELWEKFAKPIGYPYLFPLRKNNRNCTICYEAIDWYAETKAARDNAIKEGSLKAALVYSLYGLKKPGPTASAATHKEYYTRVQTYAKAKRGSANRVHNINTRYMDLNLHSWMYRGTIEFRSHHGTMNSVEMVGWTLTALQLMHLAEKYTYTQIAGMDINTLVDMMHPTVQNYLKAKGYSKENTQ